MLRLIPFLLAALTLGAADNPWDKVRDLKSGVELRIYKKGGKPPILATMDEATDDRLMVVIKNEQAAIAKDDIDRLDFRPRTGSRATKETRTTTTDNTGQTPVGPVPQGTRSGPSTSTTTSFGTGSKPDFETIYRRTAATSAPNK
jgi:hypothetical protein